MCVLRVMSMCARARVKICKKKVFAEDDGQSCDDYIV